MKVKEILTSNEFRDLSLEPEIKNAFEKAIAKYTGKTAYNIAFGLKGILYRTKEKETIINYLKKMSLDDIVNTIESYKGYANSSILQKFMDIAYKDVIYNKKNIIKFSEIMSRDNIVNTIHNYKEENAVFITNQISDIAIYTSSQNLVDLTAKLIMKQEDKNAIMTAEAVASVASTYNNKATELVIETLNKYPEIATNSISKIFKDSRYHTKDSDTIIKLAEIMSLEKVIKTANRFKEPLVNNFIIEKFGELAYKDIEYKIDYNVNKFSEIMSLDSVVNTVESHHGGVAEDITKILFKVFNIDDSEEAINSVCKLIKKVGSVVASFLDTKDLIKIHKEGLDRIIDGREHFNAVANYLKSDNQLIRPNKDNLSDYTGIVNNYLSDKYGIKKKISLDKALTFFSTEENYREKILDLINNSSEKDPREYSLASNDNGGLLDLDKRKLPYLSIIAITGSKNKKDDNEAFKTLSQIVGEKTVKRARNEFNSNYKAKLMKKLSNYIKNEDIPGALRLLEDTNNKLINEILLFSNYNNGNFVQGSNVLYAVESNNPVDYDNRIQIACVYFPQNYGEGEYNYCKDDRFSIIRYDINGKSVGSAICYKENENFLVDSVEGHRTFRKHKIFEIVYKDLIQRAISKECQQIIFNSNGINETAKRFAEYLEDINLKKSYTKMKLETKGYLDANKYQVEGYVVNLNSLRQ